jgi:site-specific DNA-methyltransferase (adenine-specific)
MSRCLKLYLQIQFTSKVKDGAKINHTPQFNNEDYGKKKNWGTPQGFYDQWNANFDFDLDAAADKELTKCDNWFGVDHDDESRRNALTLDWADYSQSAIWCNPPYGRELPKFLVKGLEASKSVPVVFLLPNSTDTRWFHDYCLPNEVVYVKGRLTFGNYHSPAGFGSIVVIMGGNK